jgi:hypothetical protein
MASSKPQQGSQQPAAPAQQQGATPAPSTQQQGGSNTPRFTDWASI